MVENSINTNYNNFDLICWLKLSDVNSKNLKPLIKKKKGLANEHMFMKELVNISHKQRKSSCTKIIL